MYVKCLTCLPNVLKKGTLKVHIVKSEEFLLFPLLLSQIRQKISLKTRHTRDVEVFRPRNGVN